MQPQEQHLAPLERAAGGHVGLAERQRERDELDLGDLHQARDQQAGGEQQAEAAEQGAGRRRARALSAGPSVR